MTENTQKNLDKVILSSGGRKQSMLETLMKQRQELIDQKQSINQGENGTDLKSHSEEYDKRIAALDEMIAQVEAQQEEVSKESSGIYERPKTTEQQAQAEKAKRLMDIAAVHDQAQALLGLRTDMLARTNAFDAAELAGKVKESAMLHAVAMQVGDHVMKVAKDIKDSVQEKSEAEEFAKVPT